jgi:hypothetical protein
MDTQETSPLPENALAAQERWPGSPDPIKAAALGLPRPDWNECLQQLKPTLDHVVRLIRTAPLLLGEKDDLALSVAAYFFHTAAVTTRKHYQLNAREIADRIVEIADQIVEHVREEPNLQLIETR